VRVKLLLVPSLQHGGIAPRASQGNLHRLVEELEALHLVNGGQRRLRIVEDDEGLTLGLEVRLGYNVNDIAKLGKYCAQRLFERLRLDAFFEVAYVDPGNRRLVFFICASRFGMPCMCRSAMTHT
jgi:hypothetical protein